MVAPILLAAGQSSRFGSDKLCYSVVINKIEKPLILHTIDIWLSCFPTLNVVIDKSNIALTQLLAQSEHSNRLHLVAANEPHKGMSASLKSGVLALSHADSWLIGLADMPFIHPSVIQYSVMALEQGVEITLPFFANEQGHPVGFAHQYYEDMLALTGDKGAKVILQKNKYHIFHIASPDNGIHRDIDTPESLKLISK